MKNVRFANTTSVNFIPKISRTQSGFSEQKKQIWYDKDDIKSFCRNVKDIQSRHLKATRNKENGIDMDDDNEEYFSSAYFLSREQLHERKKRKCYANKVIIQAQNKLNDKDLALASYKLTEWARDNALKHAENHAKMALSTYESGNSMCGLSDNLHSHSRIIYTIG